MAKGIAALVAGIALIAILAGGYVKAENSDETTLVGSNAITPPCTGTCTNPECGCSDGGACTCREGDSCKANAGICDGECGRRNCGGDAGCSCGCEA